jgi:hypothetical protein
MRARKLLAGRLARYGLAVSAGTLAAALSDRPASASVTGALVASTARAAVLVAAGHGLTAGAVPARVLALTEGVVKAMLLTKLRAFVAVGVLTFVSAGVVALAYRTTAAEPARTGAAPAAVAAAEPAADDLEALRLEVEALRKSLQATRQELRNLAAEVRSLKREPGTGLVPRGPGGDTNAAPTGPVGPAPRGGALDLPNTTPGPQPPAGGRTSSEPATSPRSQPPANVTPTTRPGDLFRTERAPDKPDGGDALAEVEAALKKLREDPTDEQGADALEKALRRLKERTKPEGSWRKTPNS